MKNVDLAIVGGGLLGLFSAWHALKAGKTVAVFEAGNRASGASVRNFGQIVPSGQSLAGWRQLGIRSLELYRELDAIEPLPIAHTGSRYIASDDQELQLLEEMAQLDRDMGYASRLDGATATCAAQAGLCDQYAMGSLFYPGEITADSPRLLPAILAILQGDSRFTYLPNSPVLDVEPSPGRQRVRAAGDIKLDAKQVLVCCGHRLNGLFADAFAKVELRISRLQMMETQPLAQRPVVGNVLSGLSIRRYSAFAACPSHKALSLDAARQPLVDAGIHLLFTQRPGGELVIGDSHHYYSAAEVDSAEYHVDMQVNEMILGEARKILAIDEWPLAKIWNGYYCETADGGALTETVCEGVHLLTGIGGKGMSTGPGLAEQVIETILAERSLAELRLAN